MSLTFLDTGMVIGYAVFIFGLAQWVSRRSVDASSAGYFLADRTLPWWAMSA